MGANGAKNFFAARVGMVSTSTSNSNTGSSNAGITISVLHPGNVAV
jgi:hypothetical protein